MGGNGRVQTFISCAKQARFSKSRRPAGPQGYEFLSPKPCLNPEPYPIDLEHKTQTLTIAITSRYWAGGGARFGIAQG